MSERTLTEARRKDIGIVIEYLWADEKRHYEEDGRPSGHVFEILRRLKKWVGAGTAGSPAAVVSGPADAAAFFFAELPAGQTEERVFVLPLSGGGKVLAKPILVSVGHGKESAAVEAGEIFREALKAGAEEIIVAHNHPSGKTAPSKADIAATLKLREAGNLLNVPLLDHLILGRKPDGSPDFVSFAEMGLAGFA